MLSLALMAGLIYHDFCIGPQSHAGRKEQG